MLLGRTQYSTALTKKTVHSVSCLVTFWRIGNNASRSAEFIERREGPLSRNERLLHRASESNVDITEPREAASRIYQVLDTLLWLLRLLLLLITAGGADWLAIVVAVGAVTRVESSHCIVLNATPVVLRITARRVFFVTYSSQSPASVPFTLCIHDRNVFAVRGVAMLDHGVHFRQRPS